MNMILRKRLANRGGRRGFTLVEVIVVLVILAILAAIAIPALTGYIDKANLKKFASQLRTQMIAVQTMINEQYAAAGGITTHSGILTDLFQIVTKDPDIPGAYKIALFTKNGIKAYEELTGDTDSFYGKDVDHQNFFQANIDASGNIKWYEYARFGYFENNYLLCVNYVEDIDSSDPITVALKDKWSKQTNGRQNIMASGFTFARYDQIKKTYEKLN
ncbi:MAG: prepilin-type N-terminal cleavage/methylation domain-containing protein [Clostridiales Family XIII bacterium]|jgi:prepilin-type N-terminal cleavage/methylation domain-containing protein|nr:prepilin-type N-terminal cleavage/methylation domain-containing protein [Clostridiales Family XIII bacterium]